MKPKPKPIPPSAREDAEGELTIPTLRQPVRDDTGALVCLVRDEQDAAIAPTFFWSPENEAAIEAARARLEVELRPSIPVVPILPFLPFLSAAERIREKSDAIRDCERNGDFRGLPPAERPHLGSEALLELAKAVQAAIRPADVSVVLVDKKRFARAPQDERDAVVRGVILWLHDLAPEHCFIVGDNPDATTDDRH